MNSLTDRAAEIRRLTSYAVKLIDSNATLKNSKQSFLEQRLRASLAAAEGGVAKNPGGKGWLCIYCPAKQLKKSRDIKPHLASKGHIENEMMDRLAR